MNTGAERHTTPERGSQGALSSRYRSPDKNSAHELLRNKIFSIPYLKKLHPQETWIKVFE